MEKLKNMCPYNYMEANLGIHNEHKECLLKTSIETGYRQLLDISHEEYHEVWSALQELISKSEQILYTIEQDKDVKEKKWWLDERCQLAEVIDEAKKY